MQLFGTTRSGWVGIDAGTCAIKVAQVERMGQGLLLRDAVVVPRRKTWLPDPGQIQAASAGELRAAVSLGQTFAGRTAACALPMHLCHYHELQAIAGDDVEQRAAIAQELELLQEGALDGYQFDYWPLDGGDDGSLTGAWGVISTGKTAAEQVARELAQARFRCQILDATPTAVARSVQLMFPDALRSPIAAIDWGYTSATLCIVQAGRPRFVRTLRGCGLATLLQPAARTLHIPEEEAALLLRSEGLPSGDTATPPGALQRTLADIAAQPLRCLIDELQRTLTYLDVHRHRLMPEQICLLGGGALLGNLVQLLAQELALPVQLWSLPHLHIPAELREMPQVLLAQAISLSILGWEA